MIYSEYAQKQNHRCSEKNKISHLINITKYKKNANNPKTKQNPNKWFGARNSEIFLYYPYKTGLKTTVAGFQLIYCPSEIVPIVQNYSCLGVT